MLMLLFSSPLPFSLWTLSKRRSKASRTLELIDTLTVGLAMGIGENGDVRCGV